jgi:hypothetical protein
MASNEPISGIRLLTKIGSTLVGAQTDATLNVPSELREIITKDDFGFVKNLSGRQEWSVSHSGLVLNDSGDVFISNEQAKLELETGDPATYVEIPSLDSIGMTLNAEMANVGALDKPLWRYIRPAQRSAEFSIEGSYYDPASDNGAVYGAVMDAKDSSTRIPARFTIAGKTFSCSVAPGDLSITAPAASDDVSISVSFASDGQVTQGGTAFDSAISMIIDGFFNETEVACAIEHHNDSGVVSGSTTYTGNGYFTSISISAQDGQEATMDAEVMGNGPLSRAQAA